MIVPQPGQSLLEKLNTMEQAREEPNVGDFPRLHRRFIVCSDALLHPVHRRQQLDATPIDIKLRDISPGGLGFIYHQPLINSTSWRVELQLAGYAIGYQALVIRHVSEVGDDVYFCGASFIIDTALMALLGVDPALLDDHNGDGEPDRGDSFVAPGEVA